MLAAMAAPAFGQGLAAGPGANEIRIGNTMPYTGPASVYGVIGKVMAAYFDKVNAEGGIRGRKMDFARTTPTIRPRRWRRPASSSRKTTFSSSWRASAPTQVGGPPLFELEEDPAALRRLGRLDVGPAAREFPWTMGFLPSYQTEAHIYSHYILENHPRSKIAVLYRDDGFGKDYVKGLKDGLGGKVPIVAEAPYKVTDTSIDAQMAKLKASGADIFMQFTTPKFAVMAIKRNAELGWKPVHFLAVGV